MRRGCDTWLMLVQSASHMVIMETNTCAGVREGSVIDLETSCCNDLVAEFADVFEPPGMPAENHIVYRIELKPGAKPLFRREYQVSATKLAEIRR